MKTVESMKLSSKWWTTAITFFAIQSAGWAQESEKVTEQSPRIVNIVNFVRLCEPRIERFTDDVLFETVVEQIKTMDRHQLRGTFLLQYDALMEPRYQELLTKQPQGMFEVGAWWEIPQPLVEKAGLKWRGRYPWDWHADVGFSTGYTPEEREKLVDVYMADFKKIFGVFPKSVGSWFIDAHTLKYMHDKYGIVASCNCKDQIGTDGYTLWGGYWNQAYYPSQKNSYMPAQNVENQIPVPVFRMLGSDPIHQYDNGLGGNRQRVVSLEPVYPNSGGNAEWCRWYFDAFVDGAAMGYAYTQAGQENSFTWNRMAKGFKHQMSMLEELKKDGKVTLLTLSEAGEWFRAQYKVTPPTSVTVLNDHTSKNQKTVWFNSRYFRANLLWEDGSLRFRDIHKFDESLESDYLRRKVNSNQCNFFTLPVVDGFRWTSKTTASKPTTSKPNQSPAIVAGLRLHSEDGSLVTGGTPIVDDATPGQLVVRWPVGEKGGEFVLSLDEKSIVVTTEGNVPDNWYFELTADEAAVLPFDDICEDAISAKFLEHQYQLKLNVGKFSKSANSIFRIHPQDKKIVLDLSQASPDGPHP